MSRRPLPKGWEWRTLGQVAQIDSNLVSPASHGEKPHVAPNHIESWTGRLLPYTTIAADGVTSPKHLFKPGHIVYSKIRPYLAKAVLVDFEGLCSGDMYPISTTVMEPRFLLRWMLSPEFTDRVAQDQGRTVLPKINQEALLKVDVPVPPMDVQRRIVAKLDALLAQSRAAREQLEAVPALVETYRQSVLAAAFRGDLTADWRKKNPNVEPASKLLERIRLERRSAWEAAELAKMTAKGKPPKDDKWKSKYVEPKSPSGSDLALPKAWCVEHLEALCEPERGIPYGIVQTGEPVENGVPTVRCGDIKNFDIDVKALKLVSPRVDAQYPRTRLSGGEVLLAIRGSVGEVAVAGASLEGANISREVAMIPTLEGVDPRFLMYFLKSPLAQAALFRHVKGVAQQGINLADLRTLPMPLASLEEQRELVARVETQLSRASQAARNTTETDSVFAEMDRGILARAFRGELAA